MKKARIFRLRTALVILIYISVSFVAEGQIVTGSIVGRALDPSGAVMPEVKVSLININTQLTRMVVTNSSGEFIFPDLPPGIYSLSATAPGFKQVELTGIRLEVAHTVNEDLHFTLGTSSQIVTVQAAPVAVESQTSSVSQVINTRQIVNLPLNGRNFMQLGLLASGVVPAYESRSATITAQSGRSNMAFHVSGSRGDTDSFLIDGVETRNMWFNSPSILLSPDATQEFSMQKNMFPAQYGDGTEIVNMVTKSGTNAFHGSVYEFVRNNAFDSANFFDNYFGRPKFPLRQNQFGASAGGPILKNKLFFFADYEGFRFRQANTLSALVPTPAQLEGDLSHVSSKKKDPVTGSPALINPFTGQAFPGNQIPASMISSVVKGFEKYIPAPNANLPGINLVVNPTTQRTDNQFTERTDFNLSAKDTLFGRYIYYNSSLLQPGIAPLYGNVFPYGGQNFALEETHIFSPTLLNVFKVGFNRSRVFHSWQNTPSSVDSALGIKNLTQVPAEFGLPTFSISGYSGLGGTGVNQGGLENLFQYTDEVTWSRSRHELMFGTDIRRIQFQQRLGLDNDGVFTFDGRYTGNALGDFLLGTLASATAQQGLAIANWRTTAWAFYAEDNFKATRRLTLNLGLRYEYNSPPYEINGKEGFFDVASQRLVVRTPANSLPIQLPSSVLSDQPNYQPGIWSPDYVVGLEPRVGLAYSLAANTVLRGGYGIFSEMTQGNELQGKMNFPPLVITQTINGSLSSPNELLDRDAFPSISQLNLGTLAPFSVDPSDRPSYVQQWNMDLQHTFHNSYLFEIAYVGSKGTHLAERVPLNQAFLPNPSNPTPIQQRVPYPGWGEILSFNFGESSDYNALQSRLQRRFSNGLSFLASYTWSHSLDTASRGSGGTWHQNMYDRKADYGNSDFQANDVFTLGYTYQLPFGPEKRFLAGVRGVTAMLIGGWEVNGITTFMTGNYENVLAPGTTADVGPWITLRADEVSGCNNNGNLPRSQRTILRYFNTSCFVAPPFGTFGNAGRNIVETPGLNNWDLSLFKITQINERVGLQFRAEFFNAWNHAQFGVPNMSVVSPTFGQILSARDPREIQFALKLLW